jgi:hypothetical protein
MMVPELSYLATVALAAPILLVIMLLPAALELKKPRDAGPRCIMLDFFQTLPNSRCLVDLEESCELDNSVRHSINVVLGKLQILDV